LFRQLKGIAEIFHINALEDIVRTQVDK